MGRQRGAHSGEAWRGVAGVSKQALTDSLDRHVVHRCTAKYGLLTTRTAADSAAGTTVWTRPLTLLVRAPGNSSIIVNAS